MKVFIAGIMQGSRLDREIDDQSYRTRIADAVLTQYPTAEIVDPNELHPEGVSYGDQQARTTLLALAGLAGQSDLLVAYAPHASMGTAIEMWQAFQAGAVILAISPMAENWVVKHLSDAVFADLEAFRAWLADGGLQPMIGLKAGAVLSPEIDNQADLS
ncbi:MAG: hypothetical protein ACK2U9_03350 [Anaerolineae bacterium]